MKKQYLVFAEHDGFDNIRPEFFDIEEELKERCEELEKENTDYVIYELGPRVGQIGALNG